MNVYTVVSKKVQTPNSKPIVVMAATCTPPASLALVPYVRIPRLHFSATLAASELSRWDPHAVLCLPAEASPVLLALLHAVDSNGGASTASAALHERSQRIREAYLDLAARFHPDGASASASHRQTNAPWVSLLEHFNAIAMAYRLLRDPFATVAYLRDAAQVDGSSSCASSSAAPTASRGTRARGSAAAAINPRLAGASHGLPLLDATGSERAAAQAHDASDALFVCDEVRVGVPAPAPLLCRLCVPVRATVPPSITHISPPLVRVQDIEWLAREDRRARGIAERRGMAVQIDDAYALHMDRQRRHGDGFFVAAALYGRAGSVRAVAADVSGGRPVCVATVIARYSRSRRRAAARAAEGADGIPPAPLSAATAAAAIMPPLEEWGTVIDVAGVLQSRVEVTARDASSESAVVQLCLHAGSKAGALEGLWDPCDGEDKALWLRYEFLGRVHEALIADEAPLKCPLRSE